MESKRVSTNYCQYNQDFIKQMLPVVIPNHFVEAFAPPKMVLPNILSPIAIANFLGSWGVPVPSSRVDRRCMSPINLASPGIPRRSERNKNGQKQSSTMLGVFFFGLFSEKNWRVWWYQKRANVRGSRAILQLSDCCVFFLSSSSPPPPQKKRWKTYIHCCHFGAGGWWLKKRQVYLTIARWFNS